MEEAKDLKAKRIEAYEYIRATICDRLGVPTDTPDLVTELADKLGGKFGLKDSLKALREGKANPTAQLVEAFKSLFLPVIAESEINSYLIDPFK
jgi:hypothetical protein